MRIRTLNSRATRGALAVALVAMLSSTVALAAGAGRGPKEVVGRVNKTNEEWRKVLTVAQYHVLREKGTERAFTGAYWDNHEPGLYRCAGCGLTVFSSTTKFDSGTGWPSFWAAIDPTHVKIIRDTSLGMVRDEAVCARCGGHLGHLFDDGPAPTHQRYCMNSVSMKFEKGRRAP